MKRLLLTYTLALFLLPVKAGSGEKLSPADYVNPFIGTLVLQIPERFVPMV